MWINVKKNTQSRDLMFRGGVAGVLEGPNDEIIIGNFYWKYFGDGGTLPTKGPPGNPASVV